MPAFMRSLTRGVPLLVALLGCGAPPFKPPAFCDSCPLPPTTPPVVRFIAPSPGDTITRSYTLIVAATDDKQVTGVEFFRSLGDPTGADWIKLQPGLIAASPYTLDLSRYPDSLPTTKEFIHLLAVAHDVEGNADTADVTVYFDASRP